MMVESTILVAAGCFAAILGGFLMFGGRLQVAKVAAVAVVVATPPQLRGGLLVSSLAVAGLLSGCAELKKADDWAMNKVLVERGQVGQLQPATWAGDLPKVPPEARCRFTSTYRESENCCLLPRYTTALDVDTAYAKARVEYGFKEKKPYNEGRDFPGYHGFVYETHPATLYRMFGEVTPRSDVRLSRGIWMGLVISKASATTADVEAVYCEIRNRSMKEQLTWHTAVHDSIRTTLPPATPDKKAP
jgi:hypothetical protein